MWLIPNVPLRCGKFKAHYDAALFTKSAMMRHYLQSPLLHGTLKPVATQQYFTKSQNHFHKAQILIWYYFYKAQILIWHYFTKPKYYFGNSFIKPKVLIWQLSLHYFYKNPNANLASILQSPKPF